MGPRSIDCFCPTYCRHCIEKTMPSSASSSAWSIFCRSLRRAVCLSLSFILKNRIQFLFYIVIIYLYTCRYLVLSLCVTDMTHVIACIRTRFCRRKSIPCIIPWWCRYKTFVYPCIFSCFKKSDTKHEAREK